MTNQNQVIEIKVIDIRKITGDGNLKAFADLKIAGSFIVRGFSVIKGKEGMLVRMPRKVTNDGRWFDIFAPVHDEIELEIEREVLEAYEQS